MAIYDIAGFMDSLWDWSMLNGCFEGTNIKPSDIDGVVERNGRFLWLEGKRPGAPMPKGQFLLLKRLAQRGDTVLVVYGDGWEEITQIKRWTKHCEEDFQNANLDLFRQMVTEWFESVKKR